MCAPPDLKKWHEACGGLNERLSNPSQGVLGRFISRDPIGHSGGLNLYAYPTNPVNAVDPSGLEGLLILHTTQYCGAHSWIEFRPGPNEVGPILDPTGSGAIIGSSITWGTRKGSRIQTNVEKRGNYASSHAIGAWLSNEQQKQLFEFLRNEYPVWSNGNNCSNFARKAWEAAGQDPIQGSHWNTWGMSTPWGLASHIGAENNFPLASDGRPKASSSSNNSSSSGPNSSTSTPEDSIYGSSFFSSAPSIFGSSSSSNSSGSSLR